LLEKFDFSLEFCTFFSFSIVSLRTHQVAVRGEILMPILNTYKQCMEVERATIFQCTAYASRRVSTVDAVVVGDEEAVNVFGDETGE
jgi:hypothetical protein